MSTFKIQKPCEIQQSEGIFPEGAGAGEGAEGIRHSVGAGEGCSSVIHCPIWVKS